MEVQCRSQTEAAPQFQYPMVTEAREQGERKGPVRKVVEKLAGHDIVPGDMVSGLVKEKRRQKEGVVTQRIGMCIWIPAAWSSSPQICISAKPLLTLGLRQPTGS